MSDEKLAHVSSSLIRQLTRVGRYIPDFVPPEIEADVLKRLLPQKN